NLLGRAFAPRETEFENVSLRVLRLNKRVDRGHARDVEGLLVRDEDVVTAAVDGRSGAQDHQPVLAVRVRVLADLQSAHDASPMQALVMQPDLLAEEPLLVGEVPLHQQLAGEIVVSGQGARLAILARPGEIGVPVHRTLLLPHGHATRTLGPTRACPRRGPASTFGAALSTVARPSRAASSRTPSGQQPTTLSKPMQAWIPIRMRGSTNLSFACDQAGFC